MHILCNAQATRLPCCLLSTSMVLPVLLPAYADAATCKGCDRLALLAAFSASHLSLLLCCLCCPAGCQALTAGYLQGLLLIALMRASTASHSRLLYMSPSSLLSCELSVSATCRGGVPQVNVTVLNRPVINSTLPTNVTTSNSTTLTFTTAKNTTTVISHSCFCGMLASSDIKQQLGIKALQVQQLSVALAQGVSILCAERWLVGAASAVAAAPCSRCKLTGDNAAFCDMQCGCSLLLLLC